MARHLQSFFWVDMDHSMYTGSRWCGVDSVDTQRIGPTRTRKDLRRIGPLTVTHEVQHIILGPFRLLGYEAPSLLEITISGHSRKTSGHMRDTPRGLVACWLHFKNSYGGTRWGHDRRISIHFKSFSEVNVYNLKSIGLKVLYKTYVWM